MGEVLVSGRSRESGNGFDLVILGNGLWSADDSSALNGDDSSPLHVPPPHLLPAIFYQTDDPCVSDFEKW